MSFTTIDLANDQVLVQGTDSLGKEGETTVDASEWLGVKARLERNGVVAEAEAEIEEFFAPVHAALDKLASAGTKAEDPRDYVVVEEPTEGTEARPGLRIKLSKDSKILQAIEDGTADDLLIWVKGELALRR